MTKWKFSLLCGGVVEANCCSVPSWTDISWCHMFKRKGCGNNTNVSSVQNKK
jgi:hypothetical protein